MQKTLIVLIVGITGLLAVGCASTPTMKSVAGTYEVKLTNGNAGKFVLLENGVLEAYENGKKGEEAKWKIINKEIHFVVEKGRIGVFRVNKDSSITTIAVIRGGERGEVPKDQQGTLKKTE